MRPPTYKHLGETQRLRVPLYKELSSLLLALDKKAEKGYDVSSLLQSFIESIED